MADIKPFGKALFLREEELRRGIELMFFAYRDFTGEADSILAEQNMGWAHHRAIYFIGRHPGMTSSGLLHKKNLKYVIQLNQDLEQQKLNDNSLLFLSPF